MKKLAPLLCLLLLLPLTALADDAVIVDRIKNPDAPYPFAEDTVLLEVYFPKIYGVDAAFVRCGEYSMLIDCGGAQWESVQSLLEQLGVTRVTYAVNSHPDADHIGGYQHVLESIPADTFLYGFPEDYPDTDRVCHDVYDKLHEWNIPMRRAVNGETLPFGAAEATVYQLEDDSLARVNNRSVMLMIGLGERRVFFTGDIQMAAQRALAAMPEIDLRADILKYPHHGYALMQTVFIDKVSPRMTVLTSGEMEPRVRDQLAEYGIPYAMTWKGVLRLTTDGSVWLVERVK